MISSRFWELAAGVLLFQILSLRGWAFDGTPYIAPKWFKWGSGVSLLLLIVSFVHPQFGAIPAPGAFLVVLGTLGLLIFCHGQAPGSPVLRMLELRPVVFIGTISYSLYLWHWPVFVLFRWTVGLDSFLGRLCALALSFALALASYYLVERSIRNLKVAKRAPKTIVVLVSIAIIVSSAWLATAINKHQSTLSISTVTTHPTDWYPIGSWTDPRYPGCVIQQSMVTITSDTVTTYTRAGCSPPVSGPDIYVIGDSHVGAYQPTIFDYVLRTGATATVSYVPGCGVLSLMLQEEQPPCSSYRKAAIDDVLAKMKHGQVVFLPSLRLPRFTDQDLPITSAAVVGEVFNPVAHGVRTRATLYGENFFKAVVAKGGSVLIEGVPPVFREAPFRCADWYDRSNPVCFYGPTIDRKFLLGIRQPAMKVFSKLSSEIPHVSIWDPLPILCPAVQKSCSAFRNRRPLFFDGDHMSGFANTLLGPSLEQAFEHSGR